MADPTRPVRQEDMEVDYERQFQEDLERACSLSLESLALDKFRLQKQSEHHPLYSKQASHYSEPDKRAQVTGQIAKVELKSRPRPGSFNTGGPRVSQIIAPPPTALRRNSNTSSAQSTPEPSNSDLINFNSPSPTDKAKRSTITLLNQLSNSSSSSLPESVLESPGIVQLAGSSSNMSAFYSTGHYNTTLPYNAVGAPTRHSSHQNFSEDQYKHYGYTSGLSANQLPYNTLPSSFAQHTSTTSIGGPYKTVVPITNSTQNIFSNSKSIESSSDLHVLKIVEKRDNSNLIDLTPFDSQSGDDSSVRVSVLEAFDPLLTSRSLGDRAAALPADTTVKVEIGEEIKEPDEADSQWSGSFYDAYDPFDYMYAQSMEGSQTDPVYAAVVKECTAPVSPCTPPPLPPRNSAAWNTIERRRSSLDRRHKVKSRLYENVKVMKRRAALHDPDIQAFYNMVKTIRVSSTVEHVILHVVYELEGELLDSVTNYQLKVWGLSEYLVSATCLLDYEYVHQCLKLERDVTLTIIHINQLGRPLARTAQDDNRDCSLKMEDILPNEPTHPISHDSLIILLETVECEMERVVNAASEMSGRGNSNIMPSLQPERVGQAVKAICALMGNVETMDITEAVEGFKTACLQFTMPEYVSYYYN